MCAGLALGCSLGAPASLASSPRKGCCPRRTKRSPWHLHGRKAIQGLAQEVLRETGLLAQAAQEAGSEVGPGLSPPRIEYDAADPTITSIEEIDWELVTSLDTLVVHVLACTVPSLKDLLDRLNFSVDRKPKLAPGDGPVPTTLADRWGSWWPA